MITAMATTEKLENAVEYGNGGNYLNSGVFSIDP